MIYCLLSQVSLAQIQSTQKCLLVNLQATTTLQLPATEIIDWSSLVVYPEINIAIDSTAKKISITEERIDDKDTVEICYRIIPKSLFQDYGGELDQYKEDFLPTSTKVPIAQVPTKNVGLLADNNIRKSGSLSRGVLFGNRQSLVVNSALNLQMDGKLSDNLFIRANITDQNIPYQPEGNTQNIQELDNVFIKIYNEKFAFTAGDVVFKKQNNHFLRYLKNVQGATARYSTENEKYRSTSQVGGSVAKGKFASVNIQPIDGVQGPYQISIPEAGRFAIVIANAESVYLDGQKLNRGYDQDYVIDYNLAEITFNPQITITGFSRIRVDVEYADQNYSRNIITAQQSIDNDKGNIDINFYQEKDNERRPLNLELSQAVIGTLADAGDNPELASISSIDSTGFMAERIMYQLIDTTVAMESFQVLVFSEDTEKANYTASFANLGLGNGDYRQERSTANGLVYRWVAPQGGVSQGEYAPVVTVPLPSMKQMISVDANRTLGKHQLRTAIALSNKDDNLFSMRDDDDNTGNAVMLDYQFKEKITGFLGFKTLIAQSHFEQLNEDFNAIDRFRDVDFDRSWGTNRNLIDITRAQDQLASVGIQLSDGNQKNWSYEFATREKGTIINGSKHTISLHGDIRNLKYSIDGFQTDNDGAENLSQWRRVKTDILYGNKAIKPGYLFELDQTTRYQNESPDSAIFAPLHFLQHGLYFTQGDSSSGTWRLEQLIRTDKAVKEGILQDTTRSYISSLLVEKQLPRGSLNGTLSYRSILDAHADTTIANNLMANISWQQSFWQGVLDFTVNYSAIQSRELQRAFVFVQVNTGEGTHTWRDEDNNGLQDLNEFYLAINFDERNFIKVFLPTNEYTLAFGNLVNAHLNIRPRPVPRTASSFLQFMGKWSASTAMTVDQKDTKDSFIDRLNPFSASIADATTLAARRSYRGTLFYNQRNPVYGFNIGFISNNRKSLLTNGDEWLGNQEIKGTQRLRVKKDYTLFLTYKRKSQRSESSFLTDRNYEVGGNEAEVRLQWQPSGFFRLSTAYIHSTQQSQQEAQGLASFDALTLETRWNRGGKQNFNANFSYKDIRYDGEENTALSYVLLDALRPGLNLLWNVNMQMNLINGLQLTLTYNGRKSADDRPVNIGQMRVTALF